ncbi:MAG: fumarylacetoacetate hydrolase family protein [Gammaproteobacteria bacterium]|nr:fumarylacetoacetate hydrolase family protein [Gammaproteobacteria bacterium]
MRLVTLARDGGATLGVRRDDAIIDLGKLSGSLPGSMLELIEAGPRALAEVQSAIAKAPESSLIAADTADYLPPIPTPGKIICLGLNYADHAKEGGHERPTYPSFFMRAATSLIGHGHPIVRPKASETLDYEAEMVAVIGARARHVGKEQALDKIFGYSVFNDGSIRKYQRLTSQWTIGKNFDATGGFGPEIVTADELPAGATGLRIQTRLNGEVLQDANTDDMLFGVAETIELLTECMTLEPGDILVMGTPSGVGHARKPPLWMKAGDVCEIEVERIGVLRNPIVDE